MWQKLSRRLLCVLPKGEYPEDPHIILRRQSSGFEARVVKEALFLVLQRVYEPLYLNACHGFRPARGFHTALRDIRHWKEVTHFVKITARQDHSDAAPQIQASSCLTPYVDDAAVFAILNQLLQLGHIGFEWKTPVLHDGCFMGKGLAFLWSTMYLHAVDCFIQGELLGARFDSQEQPRKRLQYVRHAGNLLLGLSQVDRKACTQTCERISSFIEQQGLLVDMTRSVQEEAYEGEIHLQRLKEACLMLRKRRKEHNRRVAVFFRLALARAIGATLRSRLLDRRRYMKLRRKHTSDWHDFSDDLRAISEGIKLAMPKQPNSKSVDPLEALTHEFASRVLPPEILEASYRIDRTQVQPELIKGMSTGTTWFSPIELHAPIEELKALLERAGFFTGGRETHNSRLFMMTDEGIVLLYAHIALSILKFYRCSNNLPQVRLLVNYNLRYSCLLTITGKHQKTLPWTIQRYTKDLLIKVKDESGEWVVKQPFPTRKQVLSMKHDYFCRPSPTPPWEIISRLIDLRRNCDRDTSNRTSSAAGSLAAPKHPAAAAAAAATELVKHKRET